VSQSHPLAPEVEMLQTEIDDLWRRDVAGCVWRDFISEHGGAQPMQPVSEIFPSLTPLLGRVDPIACELVEMLQTEIDDLWRRDVAGAFGEICDFCCDGVVLIRRQLGLLVRAKA
jgi:hypothetical protein